MATNQTKNVRWKCEVCGAGLLAPSRPRMDDVRRYCLPCSAETGRLVKRVAPALEKKRTASRAKSQAKQATKKKRATAQAAPKKAMQKRIAKRLAVFDAEADRIWDLLKPWHNGRYSRPPLNIVHTKYGDWGASGLWDGYRATVRVGKTGTGNVRVWETLAHELTHAALRKSHLHGNDAHGREFYTALRHVVEKRWRIRVTGLHTINGYTNSSRSWGYKVDHLFELSIEKQATGFKFTYPAAVES